ncbi:Hypothetical predicted protein [Olea europaea subsp. europaea]|uniref:Uncharacterized protein n=1 Tax=Olea europaea subsp. europaea TaxID=158383 RepID=A0A8S0SBV9_OLEEU|nr:Hypothetical predicted protein [Olea europaea subsp. europaea]
MIRRLLQGFWGSFARKFQKAKRRKEKEIARTVHGFPIAMQRLSKKYLSSLVPYDDPSVPVFDNIVRTVVEPQFHSLHVDSGVGGQSGGQDLDDRVRSGRSGDGETSGGDDRDGESGSVREGNDSEDRDGDDSEDTDDSSTPPAAPVHSPVRGRTTHTRPVETSASSLTKEEVEELLLD